MEQIKSPSIQSRQLPNWQVIAKIIAMIYYLLALLAMLMQIL